MSDEIKRADKPFLKKKVGIINRRQVDVEELQEFVVLMMKNNGHSVFLEGVQPGEFFIKSADGKQEKSIMLTPKKLTTFDYNGQYFKGWVIHEDNMMPYPQDPIHSAEIYRKTTQKLSMNYRDANEANLMKEDTKRKVMFIMIGCFVLFVIYSLMKNAGVFDGNEVQVAKVVAENVTQVAKTVGVTVT